MPTESARSVHACTLFNRHIMMHCAGTRQVAASLEAVRSTFLNSRAGVLSCCAEGMLCVQQKLCAPEHDAQDWRAKAGSAEALRHGHYRSPDVDVELIWDRLIDIAPRIAAMRRRQVLAPFDPGTMCCAQSASDVRVWQLQLCFRGSANPLQAPVPATQCRTSASK